MSWEEMRKYWKIWKKKTSRDQCLKSSREFIILARNVTLATTTARTARAMCVRWEEKLFVFRICIWMIPYTGEWAEWGQKIVHINISQSYHIAERVMHCVVQVRHTARPMMMQRYLIIVRPRARESMRKSEDSLWQYHLRLPEIKCNNLELRGWKVGDDTGSGSY